MNRNDTFLISVLPMNLHSFRGARLVAFWGGFSMRWPVSRWNTPQVWKTLVLSVQIARVSAKVAANPGAMAGIVQARSSRLCGRGLSGGIVTAPLAMPGVITGISLSMRFLLMATWAGRAGAALQPSHGRGSPPA